MVAGACSTPASPTSSPGDTPYAAPQGGGGSEGNGAPGSETPGGGGPGTTTPEPARAVLLVGNSVAGTVSVIDESTLENLGSVNVTPDLKERLDEIGKNPLQKIAYDLVKQRQVIKHFEPSNGDRFVDDVFASPDGSILYVSRSNLGDVAAFDLTRAGQPLLWRVHVEGAKADHATLSPDGRRLVVSATSVDRANVIDAKTGSLVGTFPTGHFPHQNDYSADGRHIYNGSIGDVSRPASQDLLKGARQVTVVDADTLKVIRVFPFAAGVRPSVITADESTMFSQLSYLNGLVQVDLRAGTIARTLDLPLSDFARSTYPTRDDYPHDSAHHGLAMTADGKRLCDAGTIDNTVSVVDVAAWSVVKTIDVGLIPYWATTSGDSRYCFVSLSGADSVTVVDYAGASVVKEIKVGHFPQRSRLGRVREAGLKLLAPSPG